jgi:hypothetical protein
VSQETLEEADVLEPLSTPLEIPAPLEETDVEVVNVSDEGQENQVEKADIETQETVEPEAESFEVTETVYEETFVDIEALVRELNHIIKSGDHETWRTYLTEEYIREASRPEYLKRWNDNPWLSKNHIVLENLEDFFRHVVVPTRTKAKLDKIEFADESHVYAFTELGGKAFLLYYLVRTDEGWKIAFYQ